MNKANKIAIVTPVYNDWESLNQLIKKTHDLGLKEDFEFIIINDCSPEQPKEIDPMFPTTIINLKVNLGHQRAIAIGLAHCYQLKVFSEVIVLDSDGEDDPNYIPELLDKSRNTQKIVFAKRVKRQEGLTFKFFYWMYKLIFKILVGKTISFGNYCIINNSSLEKVIFIPELWNHLSAAIIKSKIPYTMINTNRAKRFFGSSKMNLNSLVIHGFSAISIFIETVLSRTIFATLFVFLLSIALSGVVLYRKFVLNIASPGWATTSLFGFTLVSLMMLVFCFLLGLSYLNSRKEQMDINYLRDNYEGFTK